MRGLAGKIISLAFIAVIMILGSAAWFLWKDSFPAPKDITSEFREINYFVNEFLVSAGVTDADIIEQYQKELKKGGYLWITAYKKIQYSFTTSDTDFVKPLKSKLKAVEGGFLNYKREKTYFLVEAGKNKRVFSKVIFVAHKKTPAKKMAALIIDDVGYKAGLLEDFFDTGVPLTYAVLPGEAHTKKIAQMLDSSGKEYILHLPMEPEGYPGVNPGKQALLCSMTADEIRRKADSIFSWLPNVKGFNFHMGSRFSADKQKMLVLARYARENGLFIVDSRTSLKSAVKEAVRANNISALYNDIFLDSDNSYESIRKNLEYCVKIAKRNGFCVAIGHIHSKELPKAITDTKKYFDDNGVKFVGLNELLEQEAHN